MPTRNVNLTPEMDRFVDERIKRGQYANASEVLRAGLRALERDEQEDQARLKALRKALIAGEESGAVGPEVFDEIKGRIRRRSRLAERI